MFNYEDQIGRYFKEKERKEWIEECARRSVEEYLSEAYGKKVVIDRKVKF